MYQKLSPHSSFTLPRINVNPASKLSSPLALLSQRIPFNSLSQNSILKTLCHAKSKVEELRHQVTERQLIQKKRMDKKAKFYKRTIKNQLKKTDCQPEMVGQSHEQIIEDSLDKVIVVKDISPKWKPPHRYKTTIVPYQNSIVLYGGLGCQKDISWAKLELNPLKWLMPDKSNPLLANSPHQNIPIYGHTMNLYKNTALIYGGNCCDNVLNDLKLMNLKSMNTITAQKAPFRRKEHASVMINKFLIIHGGLENNSEVKNSLFYYDFDLQKWNISHNQNLPFISHHKIVTSCSSYRQKKKISHLYELSGENFYSFGGKDQQGEPTSNLFKFRIKEQGQIGVEQINFDSGPEPRYSMCLEYIDSGYLLVYGGKTNDESSSFSHSKGIYNDLFLFHIDKRQWIIPCLSTSLPFRFGMCSFVMNNKITIFGGCEGEEYSSGNVLQLKLIEAQSSNSSGYLQQETKNQPTTRLLKWRNDV